MANEEDSSVSEEFDETLDLQELINHAKEIVTRIQRKKENLQEFVSSMKKENQINKTVLKRFHNIEDEFKEGRKSKAEFKELQRRIDDRIKEVDGKLESIDDALRYISSKEVQIYAVKDEISKSSDDESQREELLKFKSEIQSLFNEIKIKFRQCKKVKLSLLTKFKPGDLIQSVSSWEKAAEVAREITREVNDLQKELQNKTAAVDKTEEELKQEKEHAKEQEQELLRLMEDMKIEDESKKEQVVLINTFRSLLDESEKLVRNLEDQNSNLNQIILDERKRVSDLREKLGDLQGQIQHERKSNREMNLKFEHMKVEFHAAKSENEGYKRDMEMIRKELDAIKEIKDQVAKKETKPDVAETLSGSSLEALEEDIEMKDKLLNEKYFEVEQLRSELEKSSQRVKELENDISSITEDKKAANDKLQVKEREVEELTDILSDTQTALESEKLAKDQFVIKCEMLERKYALIELQLQENDVKDGKVEEEEEIQNLREMLEEEKQKVAESTSMIEELEEQLKASEELREYEEDIKTRSIENIIHSELENRKLMEIVEDLREKLSEKDSGIEELIAHCAVEELKLKEEVTALSNQLRIYKRDCVYKTNIIERLRRQVASRGSGLGIVEEEDEESETTALVQAAQLERQLHEERLKTMKYEEALLALNKKCKEVDGAIREKDHELSQKSAEDGKRIAELLQELETGKNFVVEMEEQIENLEEILSLKEVIDKMEIAGDDTENLHKELADMKDDYAAKKLRRKDDMIAELKQQAEYLRKQVDIEQKRLQEQEDLIRELSDARDKVIVLEDEIFSQKEYIEELSDRVAEGQKLISELEGVADRERMRVATIEQLLLQDKQTYSKHLDGVKDLKKKVHMYQNHVGKLRSKVDRINRNLPATFSPRDDPKPESSNGKTSPRESIIEEIATHVSAVEEENEKLNAELQEERAKSTEQDEKIEQLLSKSKECEGLVEYMKDELELVRKRYQGLSGESSESDNLPAHDRTVIPEEVQEVTGDELHAKPMLLFPSIDDEKENEGDDEHEEGESGETVYFDDESERRDVQEHEEEQEAKQRELIHHLLIFEKVFEHIFMEEGKRIDVVLEKFRSVIQKNTELVDILQNLRQTLSEARTENEEKENEIKQMKKENEHLEQLGKEKDNGQQHKTDELNREIQEQMTKLNQLQENLSVEQLLKSEYEREIEILKNNIMEEREASEQLREDVERETNARYEFEVKMREIEDEAYNSASIINELQKDLETERKCYGVVTERLQEEQSRLIELESHFKEAEKTANEDKEVVEELRKSLSSEEKQRTEFLNKLERLEKESTDKDEAINDLVNQLGNERNKMEELFAEIDLEKMTKAKAEAKLQELEENFNRDELIFEELRRNVDSESAKNREISELLDKERERNFELEEKTKELEKQVLMDLELFDELKTTIEQEREHNRELDALLSEKSSAYNNRDKLLAELDDQLAEIRAALKKEELRNEELNQELRKRDSSQGVVKDLQDMLKSQIIHAEELNQRAEDLTKTNKEQNQKIQTLENALAKLKEISAQVSKELEDDLETYGEWVSDSDDEMDVGEAMADLNDTTDYSAEKNALRTKALLNNELKIKKKLINKTDEYKKQIDENCETISQLNDAIESYRDNMRATEEDLRAERKHREDTETKLNKAESELLEERKHVDSSKTDLEKLKQIYEEIKEEREKKLAEVKQLTKSMEEKAKDDDNKMITLQKLQDEKENAVKEKKEKEDECELLKAYYEEEHKFAQERLGQNQSLKKHIEELEQATKEKDTIMSELREEKEILALKVEETNNNFKTQASVLKEHKEKLRSMDAKEKYVKDLEKEIEELTHLHRRKKRTEKREAEAPNRGIIIHLKEIEDDFDGMETELSQKDEQIKRLNDECIKVKAKIEENEKRATELQDQTDSYKQLVKQHEAHAQKSANAMEKARLLCELLQTDIEIKDLTISQLNSDVYSIQSQMKDKANTKGEEGKDAYISPSHQAKKYEKEQPVEEWRSEVDAAPPMTTGKNNGELKEKDELHEQILHMTDLMEKVREQNKRVIAEKDKEIEKQEKTIALIKNLYHSLKTESKREQILRDVQLLLPEKETSDAAVVMNDLENQLKSMKDEVKKKGNTVKALKENITEIKRDEDEIDRDLLLRKENVHKLLSVQLEEKEKKLKRMENLLEGLREIYYGKVEKEFEGENEDEDSSALPVASVLDRNDAETKSQNDNARETREASNTEHGEETVHSDKSNKSLQAEKEIVLEDENVLGYHRGLSDVVDKQDNMTKADKDFNPKASVHGTKDRINDNEKNDRNLVMNSPGEQSVMEEHNSNESCTPLGIQPSNAKRVAPGNIKAEAFPTSGWKAKFLAYVIVGIGLSFLPQYLKENTMRMVLACVATPLFFLLSAIELKVYRKKAENYLRNLRVKGAIIPETPLEDDYLLDEKRKLEEESDKKVIEGLQEQLEQEIKAKSAKEGDMRGNDEVDVLEEQKRKVSFLEKTLHNLELAKIEEQQQNKTNFDEYIKLRNAVEELKRKRDAESKAKSELEDIKKNDVTKLESDLKMFCLRPRSVPLWIAVAMVVYQLTTLHPAAPCAIIILFTLYASNSWFKIKNFRNKLLEEREVAEYKSAELGDLTELLEKEHEVVETQKAAIDIMVREIDNEFVSRKGKTLTLAKMILQMKELEEMRCALKEENVEQTKDNDMDTAMKTISKDKANERLRQFFEVRRSLPEFEDSLNNFEELEKTIKEAVTFVETRSNDTENQTKTVAAPGNARKDSLGQEFITFAGVTLSIIAMVTTIIFKSYIPATLMGAQLLICLLSQRKNGQQSKASAEELQAKLDQEIKRNKANRLQIGKLKRLLATEKSLKKSDEAAKEIRLRVKERADKRKLATSLL